MWAFRFSELKVYHSMILSRTVGKIKIDWNYFGEVSVYYLSAAQCCQAKCLLSSINANKHKPDITGHGIFVHEKRLVSMHNPFFFTNLKLPLAAALGKAEFFLQL